MARILVTGSAGFIGFHLARRLLARGDEVLGLDAMTPYYDVALKEARHAILCEHARFRPLIARLEDRAALLAAMAEFAPDVVVHLAAQAGVRYSITHPEAYVDANLVGTFNVLEACRAHPVRHLLLASTSSAYGANTQMPFAETDKADTPLTLYAATKKAGEAMAHAYAHLYRIPVTALRFFTVYGPWGRPDMAYFKFTRAILAGEPIDLYNRGDMVRDFTFIDDLVEALAALVEVAPGESPVDPAIDTLSPVAPCRLVNIGAGAPERLIDFVAAIERATGRTAQRNLMDMQPGDVPATCASGRLLEALVGPVPRTPLADGVARFVAWYRDFYGI